MALSGSGAPSALMVAGPRLMLQVSISTVVVAMASGGNPYDQPDPPTDPPTPPPAEANQASLAPLNWILCEAENFGYAPSHHSILIKMAFYIQFFYLIPFKASSIPTQKSFPHRTKIILPLKQLFILIYILSNIYIIYTINHNCLPLLSTDVIPYALGIFAITILPQPSSPIHLHHNIIFDDTSPSLHTNADKLAYLATWQSLESSSFKISNFSPGSSPNCINTASATTKMILPTSPLPMQRFLESPKVSQFMGPVHFTSPFSMMLARKLLHQFLIVCMSHPFL